MLQLAFAVLKYSDIYLGLANFLNYFLSTYFNSLNKKIFVVNGSNKVKKGMDFKHGFGQRTIVCKQIVVLQLLHSSIIIDTTLPFFFPNTIAPTFVSEKNPPISKMVKMLANILKQMYLHKCDGGVVVGC